MMQRFLAAAALTMALAAPANAASISLSSTPIVAGGFDVVVSASDLFLGRDETSDFLLSFGFDVLVTTPATASFTGATSNTLFFDAVSSVPDTDVFAAASGFGLFPPVASPLALVTLHFQQLAAGPIVISLTSDSANLFQGLQFFNEPFEEGISGRITVAEAAAVPEPATLVLLGSGALIGRLRRRRRSQTAEA